MLALRSVAGLLCTIVMVSGCSATTTGSVVASSSIVRAPTPPTAAAAPTVDLLRLSRITADFPPGYPSNAQSGVRKNDAQRAATIGDLVAYGKSLSLEPTACGALLKPVRGRAGADWAAVSSVQNAEGPFVNVEVDDPIAVPTGIPGTGCDQFRFVVAGALPDGTARRLAAPTFRDSISYGLRIDFDVTNPEATKPVLVEYFYIAILDGRTLVNVWARVPSDFSAEPVLPDLLAKAVKAIRGS